MQLPGFECIPRDIGIGSVSYLGAVDFEYVTSDFDLTAISGLTTSNHSGTPNGSKHSGPGDSGT